MKSIPRFGVGLALLALVSLAGASEPQPSPTPSGDADQRYQEELLTILGSTRSDDAFLVALTQLKASGIDPRRVIPTAIRNAERLGIFNDHLGQLANAKAEKAVLVRELIDELGKIKGKENARADLPIPTVIEDLIGEFFGLVTIEPVPPWATEKMKGKFPHVNDHRTPIMPPIREGYPPPLCEDPPSEAEVLKALPVIIDGLRENVTIFREREVDKIDPPRFFPLVGPAQMHHCRWKCTVSWTETTSTLYPFPFCHRRQQREVVYLNKDHLHLFTGDVDK